MSTKFTRRKLLSSSTGMSVAVFVAACQPKVVEVEKIVKETVQVEKVVRETVLVEGQSEIIEKVVTPTPVPPEQLKGEVVTVFYQTATWESPTYKSSADMFNERYPNVELVGIGTQDEYSFVQKVTTMFAGGQPPDLMRVSAGRLIHLAPKGVFEDLWPRIEVSPLMQRIWEHLPGEAAELRFMGKQLALPEAQVISLFIYNSDLFDEKGVPHPEVDWTWEDMVGIGQQITDPEKNQYLIDPPTVNFPEASEWFWGAGGTLFSDEGRHINLDQEPNIRGMEFVADLFHKHKVAPPRELKLGEIGVSFDTGQLALSQSSSGAFSQQLGPNPTWDFNWGATYAPAGPEAQAAGVKSNGWAIGQGASNAELGWTVIEWWLGDEAQTTFAKEGQTVSRNDIFKEVGFANLPSHLHPALEHAFTHGRALERYPGWSVCQKFWREEMDPVWLGRISAREGMMSAYEKAQPALDELMAELGLS